MGTHFLSVLGTGLYEPVVYGTYGETGSKEQEFVQIALMERFAEQLLHDDGKITILLTKGEKGARKRNWDNRPYTEQDVESLKRWASEKKETESKGNIEVGMIKIGMESTLKNNYPEELWKRINIVEIENASTEEEMGKVFDAIYHAIDEGDEIIFDITHSFRSIPMLAMTVINYAKVLKNCTLKGIYYGAYEAAEIHDGVKYAPIVDLTVYNEILEWTNAAEAFMQYGVAAKMKEVYDNKMKSIAGNKMEWKPVKDKINAMQDLSMALFTCRGADMGEGDKKSQKSIKSAYAALTKKNTKDSETKAKEIKPLYPLLEKIGKSYESYFHGRDNVGVGLGVVEWSIEHNMIQQGFTALEETMVTYLCNYYGVSDKTRQTREDIVGKTMTALSYKYKTEYQRKYKSTFQKKFDAERNSVAKNLLEGEFLYAKDEAKVTVKKMMLTIPVKFIELCDKIKDRRNDINHSGFRADPTPSVDFVTDLKKYYDEFVKIMKEMGQTYE